MPSLLSKYRKKRDSTRSDDGSDRGSFGKSPTRKVSTSSSLDSGPTIQPSGEHSTTPNGANSSMPGSSKRANGLGVQLNGVMASPNRGPNGGPGAPPGLAGQGGSSNTPAGYTAGLPGAPAEALAGYSTTQMGDNAYPAPRQPPHLSSPFTAREEGTSPQTPNRLAFTSPQSGLPASGRQESPVEPEQGSQQERDLEQLREHDRTFQERYKQSMSSPPSQSPAHFFNLPASENPWAEWQIRRACPSPRFGHSANYIAARDGELFIMGGIRDMDILDDLWVIDTHMLTGYQLRTEGASVSARVGHAALTLGNAYILFGGDTKIQETDPLDNNLYLLNTTTLRWTVAEPKGPRPCGRYGHSLVNVGVKVFVFGGQVDDMFYSDMWMFDLTTLRSPSAHWEKVEPFTPAPPPRTNHTVVTYQDKIYLFGGANRDLWYSDTWCYDPALNKWTQLDCTGYVPAPCQGHAATMIGDTMYVFGGMSSQGNLIDQLFALKLTTHKWFTFQNLGEGPCPRSGHSLTAFDGDKILVWGGTDQNSSAFVLDVSRINYPDESMETETAALESSSSIDARAIEMDDAPTSTDSNAAPGTGPAAAAVATQPVQLTRETSARSTPAARNSMLFKRQSWQQHHQQQPTQGTQPAVTAPPVSESEEYASASDLPSTLPSQGSSRDSGSLPSAGLVAPLTRSRGEPTTVPVTTASELARAEAEAEVTPPKQVPVKEAQSIEDATANMPGALPRSDGLHNLTEASEMGSGTPDTLWRATSSSSSDDTEIESKDLANGKEGVLHELDPVAEHAAGPETATVQDVSEAEQAEAGSTSTPEAKDVLDAAVKEAVEPDVSETGAAVAGEEPAALESQEPVEAEPAQREVETSGISSNPFVIGAAATGLGAVGATAAVAAASSANNSAIPPRQSVDSKGVEDLQQKLVDIKRSQDHGVDARQNLAKARRDLLDNREELSKLQVEHTTLRKQYAALHESTSEQMALVTAAKDSIAAAETKAAEATERANKLEAENAELKRQLDLLKEESTERNVEVKQQDLHGRIDDLLAKWSIFPGAAVLAAGSAAGPLADREVGSSSSEDHYRDLYESQKKVIEETQADLEEAYNDIGELQAELKQAQEELKQAASDASSASELHAQHEKSEAELVTLREFKQRSSETAERLESELKQKAARCEELESEYNKSVEYLQNQQNALSKTRAELARVKETNTRLQEELSEARLVGPSPDGVTPDPDASSHSLASLNFRQAELIIKDLKTQLIIAEEERDEMRDQVRQMKRAALAEKI